MARTDEELKALYAEYLVRSAIAHVEENEKADILMGMATAYGRCLGYSFKRIEIEIKRARKAAEYRKQGQSYTGPTLAKSL